MGTMRRQLPLLRACSLAGMIGLLLSMLFARTACADADDTFNIVAGVSSMYDSNLFRLPPGADPEIFVGESTKSDVNTLTSIALRINKPYSLQRFELEATVVDSRYHTFSYLDYTAYNYAAAWRWKLTPRFHGNLTANRLESPNSFNDYSGYRIKNLRTAVNERFDGVFEVDGVWRLIGGVEQSTQTNSEIFIQEGDNRVNSANAGLRYDFPSGSLLSYRFKFGRGEYTKRPNPIPVVLLDNAFDDREGEIRFKWGLTGKTTLDARVAHFQRTSANYSARSYGGNVGHLKLDWEVSGKTRLAAAMEQELTSYQQISSSYISTQRYSLTPYWQIDAKTALRVRYAFARSEYLGAIATTPLNGRIDDLHTGMIALDWQPLRAVSLSASLQNDRRDSNQPAFDYKSSMFSITAQLNF